MKKLFLLILVLIFCFGAIAVTGRISKSGDPDDEIVCLHENIIFVDNEGDSHTKVCETCLEVIESNIPHVAVSYTYTQLNHTYKCICGVSYNTELHTYINGYCKICNFQEPVVINVADSSYSVTKGMTWAQFASSYLGTSRMYTGLNEIYHKEGNMFYQLVNKSDNVVVNKNDVVVAGDYEFTKEATIIWFDFYNLEGTSFNAQCYPQGAIFTIPVPVEVGYNATEVSQFDKWQDKNGVYYNPGDTMTATSSNRFYAVSTSYTMESYTVTFSDPYTGGNYSMTVSSGDSITIKSPTEYGMPNRSGYTFIGWADPYDGAFVSGNSYKVTEDTTFTAQYNLSSSSGSSGSGSSGGSTHTCSYDTLVSNTATCFGFGTATYKCSCGNTTTQRSDPLQHNMVDSTEGDWEYCTRCGYNTKPVG